MSAVESFKINYLVENLQISVKDDKTMIVQENPLILQFDKYDPSSPYFGYFPLGSKEPEMVLVHNDLDKIKAAAKWSIWEPTSNKTPQSTYETDVKIVPIEGKGLGMVANRAFRAGELVYQER